MPAWAAVLDGVAGKATFPSTTTSNNFDIHVYGKFVALTNGAFLSDGGTSNYFRYANNTIRFRAGAFLGNSKPYTPTLGVDVKLTVRVRPTNVELLVDDISIGSDNGVVTSMTVNTIGFFASTLYLTFTAERVVIDDFNTPTSSRNFYNDVAAGSNTNWKDQTVNGQDATLINTATDGSQWELIGGGGVINIPLSSASYSVSSNNVDIDLTGEISVNLNSASQTYSPIDIAIDLTKEIVINASSTNYSYQSKGASFDLSGLIDLKLKESMVNYGAQPCDISLQGVISLGLKATQYTYNALGGTISLRGPILLNLKNKVLVKRKANSIRVKRKNNNIRVK